MTNFKTVQKIAKKKVIYLIFLFFLATSLVILTTDMTFAIIFMNIFEYSSFFDFLDSNLIKYTNLIIFSIILFGSAEQHTRLRQGGFMVPSMLGAKKIPLQTTNLKQKMFLNIVEEISVASNVPIPEAYLLKDSSINAFVSGYDSDDVVICITKGALEHLNREELQGVVAHEFSHIFHGDIRLNMFISSLIFGLLSLAIIGKNILFKMHKKPTPDIPFRTIIGTIFLIFGFLGLVFGSIIKAGISRQKEFLADASAVGFTRSNTGLANALKKVDFHSSYISSPNSELFSHFYFACGEQSLFSSLIASHPSIEKRILALEPSWDGVDNFHRNRAKDQYREDEQRRDNLSKIIMTTSTLNELKDFKQLNKENIQKVQLDMEKISKRLKQMTNEPFTSQAVILALLARDNREISDKKLKSLKLVDQKLYQQVLNAYNLMMDFDTRQYLILLLLCLASLKLMSINQYQSFKDILHDWIYENSKVVFFEWLVLRILVRSLDIHFKLTKPVYKRYHNLSQLKPLVEHFTSFLCIDECDNLQEAKNLHVKIMKRFKMENFDFTSRDSDDFTQLDINLNILCRLIDPMKNVLLQISYEILKEDKILCEKNRQILYALSLSLKTPLPYM